MCIGCLTIFGRTALIRDDTVSSSQYRLPIILTVWRVDGVCLSLFAMEGTKRRLRHALGEAHVTTHCKTYHIGRSELPNQVDPLLHSA